MWRDPQEVRQVVARQRRAALLLFTEQREKHVLVRNCMFDVFWTYIEDVICMALLYYLMLVLQHNN
ncbi:1,4-dihydroxy-2-naphthoyl-CoA thioesterase 1-like [Iris pallida]|uniref:1,4-dihydroxy-2-naphthoyl-CoA thioesterase 1-like n=1 Tax=Iris pallida TaxID=29817 RepID=A0AAX6ICW7_IRIPA|nr:1,4-dihydroxy-2-naphthoyl-CoA thioesterase 1-like [Iris pallida]